MIASRCFVLLGVAALSVACGDSDGGQTGGSSSTTAPTSTTTPTTTTTATATTTTTTAGGSTTTAGATGTTGEPALGSFYVFVTDGNNAVSTWSMDANTGDLTFLRNVDAGNSTGAMAISPDLRFLYVALRQPQSIAAFAIDPADANLTGLGTRDVGLNPVYVATDRSTSYILTADFGGDEVAVYPIEADGSVGPMPSDRQNVGARPHSIITDPSNSYVYVPQRDENNVLQFAFDENAGTLTALNPPAVAAPPNVGPRHIVMNPSGSHAYVVNEFTDSVTAYAVDGATGTLTEGQTITTLPMAFDPDMNTGADIHITPQGDFLYASNRGHDSLAMFGVSGDGATLTELGQAPTEPRPREFGMSPRGRFVYAAGQDSGMLASYSVAPDGTLSAGPVYDVGGAPLWVEIIEFPAE